MIVLDIILDFVLIPVVLFMIVLFICDLEEWDKSKKEVENTFAAAFYIMTLYLAFINAILLMSSGILACTGDYGLSLIFNFFILAFTCLNVGGLFVSEYWKRRLRG